MKKILLFILIFIICINTGCSKINIESSVEVVPPSQTDVELPSFSSETQIFIEKTKIPKDADQILSVVANGVHAKILMQEKDQNNGWVEILSTFGFVGLNGVGDVSEGSKRTPEGVYSLTTAFGIAKDPGSKLPYTQINASHYWVDDPNSQYYNQFVSVENVKKDWDSAEHLIDYTSSYQYAIAIDYNTECVPGKGSAFFVHCSNDRPTYGCVAVPKEDMIFILNNISKNAYIIIENE